MNSHATPIFAGILNGFADDIAADNAASKEAQEQRDIETLRDMISRHGETAVALMLHRAIVSSGHVNLRCKHLCRDGMASTGTINVTAHFRAPCPACKPVEHAAHMANDPMASDERRYYQRGGRNWAGD